MKKTSEIDKILSIGISNLQDTWVMIDSEELNKTGKMRLSDVIDFIHGQFTLKVLTFSDGSAVEFSDGRVAEQAGSF